MVAENEALTSSKNRSVEEKYKEIFSLAYMSHTTTIDRMRLLQFEYDNIIDKNNWPTTSELPLPVLWTSVQKRLPTVMEYLFHESNRPELIPTERNIDIKNVQRVEEALHDTVIHRMNIKVHVIRTLIDSFKLGMGYGAIEPYIITPQVTKTIKMFLNKKLIDRNSVIAAGTPYRALRYSYINPSQIYVTPDGYDFNGPGRVSTAFYIKFYHENTFRKLYDTDANRDGERFDFAGDPEKIIAEARANNYFEKVPIHIIVGDMAGLSKPLNFHNTGDKRLPVIVPVLRCYSENEHVFMANGRTVIYHEKSKAQTLRTPLIKCDPYPEGNRFFGTNGAVAGRAIRHGNNLWFNGMIDLLTKYLKPDLLYDRNKFDGGEPETTVDGMMQVNGPPQNAALYLDPPVINQSMFAFGDEMKTWHGGVAGQEEFLRDPAPGLVRGGVNALSELMESSKGRDTLINIILEMGFLKNTYQETLFNMQLNAEDGRTLFHMRKYDPDTNEEYIDEFSLTKEDLLNGYDVITNFRNRMRHTLADQSERQAMFNDFKDRDSIDQEQLDKWRIGDDYLARKLVKPRPRVLQIESENRELAMRERLAGIRKGGAPNILQQQQLAQSQTNAQQQALQGAANLT